jgi:hypothetical protein
MSRVVRGGARGGGLQDVTNSKANVAQQPHAGAPAGKKGGKDAAAAASKGGQAAPTTRTQQQHTIVVLDAADQAVERDPKYVCSFTQWPHMHEFFFSCRGPN